MGNPSAKYRTPTQYNFDFNILGFCSNGSSGVEGFRVSMRQGLPSRHLITIRREQFTGNRKQIIGRFKSI
jgi:hypothetical protein